MNNYNYNYGLALPPRSVPVPVLVQVLLGGFGNQFGWLFFGFGMIFVWAFGAFASLTPVYFWLSRVETAPGVVAEVHSTHASENDVTVYTNQYVFRVERLEAEFRGESYTTGRKFSVGDPVMVEYLSRSPQTSRIQGERSSLFAPWVLCFVGIFPAVGLAFIAVNMQRGVKGSQLLRYGKLTGGKLIDKRPTNTRINEQMVYKLTFEFVADDGQRHTVTANSHQPENLEDETLEKVLYNPYNPKSAVVVDNLPGAPAIDEFGQIQSAGLFKSMAALILPALTLLGHGGILLFMLLRR